MDSLYNPTYAKNAENEAGLRRAIALEAERNPFVSTLAGTLQGSFLGGSARTLGNLLGTAGYDEPSARLNSIAQGLQRAAQPYMAPQLDYESVNGFGSGVDFVKANLAQGVGSIGPMLAGLAAGGAPLGLAAGFGPQMGENLGRLDQDPTTDGLSERQKFGYAAPTAVAQTGLDYLVPGGYATKLARQGAAKLGTGALGKAGATIGTSMAVEGGTEVGQELLGQGMHTLANPLRDTSDDTKALIQSGLGGAIGGAPFGALDAGMGYVEDRIAEGQNKVNTGRGAKREVSETPAMSTHFRMRPLPPEAAEWSDEQLLAWNKENIDQSVEFANRVLNDERASSRERIAAKQFVDDVAAGREDEALARFENSIKVAAGAGRVERKLAGVFGGPKASLYGEGETGNLDVNFGINERATERRAQVPSKRGTGETRNAPLREAQLINRYHGPDEVESAPLVDEHLAERINKLVSKRAEIREVLNDKPELRANLATFMRRWAQYGMENENQVPVPDEILDVFGTDVTALIDTTADTLRRTLPFVSGDLSKKEAVTLENQHDKIRSIKSLESWAAKTKMAAERKLRSRQSAEQTVWDNLTPRLADNISREEVRDLVEAVRDDVVWNADTSSSEGVSDLAAKYQRYFGPNTERVLQKVYDEYRNLAVKSPTGKDLLAERRSQDAEASQDLDAMDEADISDGTSERYDDGLSVFEEGGFGTDETTLEFQDKKALKSFDTDEPYLETRLAELASQRKNVRDETVGALEDSALISKYKLDGIQDPVEQRAAIDEAIDKELPALISRYLGSASDEDIDKVRERALYDPEFRTSMISSLNDRFKVIRSTIRSPFAALKLSDDQFKSMSDVEFTGKGQNKTWSGGIDKGRVYLIGADGRHHTLGAQNIISTMRRTDKGGEEGNARLLQRFTEGLSAAIEKVDAQLIYIKTAEDKGYYITGWSKKAPTDEDTVDADDVTLKKARDFPGSFVLFNHGGDNTTTLAQARELRSPAQREAGRKARFKADTEKRKAAGQPPHKVFDTLSEARVTASEMSERVGEELVPIAVGDGKYRIGRRTPPPKRESEKLGIPDIPNMTRSDLYKELVSIDPAISEAKSDEDFYSMARASLTNQREILNAAPAKEQGWRSGLIRKFEAMLSALEERPVVKTTSPSGKSKSTDRAPGDTREQARSGEGLVVENRFTPKANTKREAESLAKKLPDHLMPRAVKRGDKWVVETYRKNEGEVVGEMEEMSAGKPVEPNEPVTRLRTEAERATPEPEDARQRMFGAGRIARLEGELKELREQAKLVKGTPKYAQVVQQGKVKRIELKQAEIASQIARLKTDKPFPKDKIEDLKREISNFEAEKRKLEGKSKSVPAQNAAVNEAVAQVEKEPPSTKTDPIAKALVDGKIAELVARVKASTNIDALNKSLEALEGPMNTENSFWGGLITSELDFERLEKDVDHLANAINDRLDALASGTKASRQDKTEGSKPNPLSDSQKQEISDYIAKTLGPKVKLLLERNMREAGLWEPGEVENTISIGINAIDPLGTAFHESMHEFFSRLMKAGDKRTIEILTNAANSRPVIRQLERLLMKHPAALEQMRNDPEERLAYAFQFWAAGHLNIGPSTKTVFERIKDFLRGLVGVVTDSDKAEIIFDMFYKGEAQDVSVVREVVARLDERDAKLKAWGDKLKNPNGHVQKFFQTVEGRLVGSPNKAVDWIGRQFATVTGETSGQGMLQAIHQVDNKFQNQMKRAILKAFPGQDKLSNDDMEDVKLAIEMLQENDGRVTGTDPRLKTIQEGIAQVLQDVHQYMVDNGVRRWDDEKNDWVPIGKLENFFPRMWDTDNLVANGDQFVADLLEHHQRELAAIAKRANEELAQKRDAGELTASWEGLELKKDPGTITEEDVARAILARLVSTGFHEGPDEQTNDIGFTPFMRSVNKRTLKWIDTTKFAKYMQKDGSRILQGYISQAVRRTESTKRFGYDGEILKSKLRDALAHELDTALGSKRATELKAEWEDAQAEAYMGEKPSRDRSTHAEKVRSRDYSAWSDGQIKADIATREKRIEKWMKRAKLKPGSPEALRVLEGDDRFLMDEEDSLFDLIALAEGENRYLTKLLEAREKGGPMPDRPADKHAWVKKLEEEVGREKFDAAMLKAGEQMKGYSKSIQAMEGTLGGDISPLLRNASSWVITYQNVRLLALTLFSNFIDPLGVLVRGGTANDAFETFKRGFNEVYRQWSGKGPSESDPATQIAEAVGTIEAAGFFSAMGGMYGSVYMNDKARRINDLFFRWNGMEALNRGVRIQATQAAINFLKRHKDSPNEHTARYFKELGIDAEDLKITDGELDISSDKVRKAIMMWVDGAVLRPNAGQRPAWASDPHYALFFHLKQFTYSFHRTILRRAWIEGKHGNMTPWFALAAAYVPIAIAADTARAMAQNFGDEPEWMKDQGLGGALAYGVQRAGLLGVGQFGVDALSNGPLDMAGPAVDQISDMVFSDRTWGEEVMRALPLNQIVRGAVTD